MIEPLGQHEDPDGRFYDAPKQMTLREQIAYYLDTAKTTTHEQDARNILAILKAGIKLERIDNPYHERPFSRGYLNGLEDQLEADQQAFEDILK